MPFSAAEKGEKKKKKSTTPMGIPSEDGMPQLSSEFKRPLLIEIGTFYMEFAKPITDDCTSYDNFQYTCAYYIPSNAYKCFLPLSLMAFFTGLINNFPCPLPKFPVKDRTCIILAVIAICKSKTRVRLFKVAYGLARYKTPKQTH